jgi:hypothetical protein
MNTHAIEELFGASFSVWSISHQVMQTISSSHNFLLIHASGKPLNFRWKYVKKSRHQRLSRINLLQSETSLGPASVSSYVM